MSIIVNYVYIVQILEESAEEQKDLKKKARLNGVITGIQKFEYFFAICLAYKILKHTDSLASALQTKGLTAVEGKKMFENQIALFQSLKTTEKFEEFWENTTKKATDRDVDEPMLPKAPRKPPARFSFQAPRNR